MMDDDPFLKPRNDLSDLPKPGEFVIYDYTDFEGENKRNHLTEEFSVKALQWNIERAYKLDEIIDLLTTGRTSFKDQKTNFNSSKLERKKRPSHQTRENENEKDLAYKDFDLMAIQEFDINCERSGYRNSALELARALKMKCVFLTEFEEIYSEKLRNKRSQGGGIHGNGLLTWWDIEKVEVVEHEEIFNWERDGAKLNEPRRGKRSTLACFLKHPLDPTRKILVYSVHLEVFCGIFGRLRQFSQILAHSRQNLNQYPSQLILGDLNTMAHGLARLLPKYCCDSMRWRSVGWSEAEWWQRNLFDVLVCENENEKEIDCKAAGYNYFLAAHHHSRKPGEIVKKGLLVEQEIENVLEDARDTIATVDTIDTADTIGTVDTVDTVDCSDTADTGTIDTVDNANNSQCIFTKEELKNLLNPHFFCPFPLKSTKTVQMAGYSGKLDWMLLRGWLVKRFGVDNELFGRSDHQLLWCEIVLFDLDRDNDSTVDIGVSAHKYHLKSINNRNTDDYNNTKNSISSLSLSRNTILSASAIGAVGILIYFLIQQCNNNK